MRQKRGVVANRDEGIDRIAALLISEKRMRLRSIIFIFYFQFENRVKFLLCFRH